MTRAEWRAEQASTRLAQTLDTSGVLHACRELFTTVWTTNIARYEPDELGDTAMTLGLQTHQNFITRAERRFTHDDREPAETHWNFEGLTVTRSGNAFVMGLAGARLTVMKVPYEHGRALRTDQLVKWEGQSHLRTEMAHRNSTALAGYRSAHPGELTLFDSVSDNHGQVRDFVVIFAGERHTAQTAAWLGVPVLGDDPVIAVHRLWWDDEPIPAGATRTASDLPHGGDLPPLTVTLKPETAQERRQ